jgi:hypothetical protein
VGATILWLALGSSQAALGNVSLVKLSADPYTNTSSFHKTQVEPDTYSFGNTIVATFQSGRFQGGGASNVGWSTSTDGGSTWKKGFLPSTTPYSTPPGPYERVTDPSVGYDAKHNTWIINTLALQGGAGVAVLASRSTDGGQTFKSPVVIASTQTNFFDKNWIACDSTATSTFYGRCYVEWDDNALGNRLLMSYSTDGGKTWTASTVPNASVIGGQPVTQPNGRVIVPIGSGSLSSVESFVSTNGGVSYTGPFSISGISEHGVAGNLRTLPLPSAEIDGSGKVYVVWQDCRFRSGCSSNDIVMSTSTDGQTWSAVVRIPIDPANSTVDHFIPGIGVDVGTSGNTAHLGLAYYYYPTANCSTSTCKLDVGFISSKNGGANWSSSIQLAGPMTLTGLPLTSQGYMVGDYISTSFSKGTAHPVFAKAKGTNCQLGNITSCNERMVAPASGLSLTASVNPAGRERPVRHARSDRRTGASRTAF